MSYRNKRLLMEAKGRPCVLCGAVGTTVAAHSTLVEHGHGMGHKAHDCYVAYTCFACHNEIDGRTGTLPKEERRLMWLTAFARTVGLWFREGIVAVRGEA